MKPQRTPFKLLLLVCVLFMGMVFVQYDGSQGSGDRQSFTVAQSLVTHGIFSDGNSVATSPSPGYAIPPGYPAVIAVVALITQVSDVALPCSGGQQHKRCQNSVLANSIIAVQLLISLLTLVTVFVLARELSHSNEIAILTLLLLLFTSRLAEYSVLLHPFVIITFLTMTSSLCLVRYCQRRTIVHGICSGLLFGLAGLFYTPLVLVPVIAGLAIFFAMDAPIGRRLVYGGVVMLAACLVMFPWAVRNFILFDEFALTHDRANVLLAARVAYNGMLLNEWQASFLYWQPGPAQDLARWLFTQQTIEKLSLANHAQSILASDSVRLIKEINLLEPRAAQYLLAVQRYIVEDIVRYLAVLPALFLRGFWGTGSLIGVFALFFLPSLLRRLKHTQTLVPFVLVFSILAGCVLAQSLVSANLPYYNEQIMFIHAYAIAHVCGELELMPIVRRGLISGS